MASTKATSRISIDNASDDATIDPTGPQIIDFETLRDAGTSTAITVSQKGGELIGEFDIKAIARARNTDFMVSPYDIYHMEGWSVRDMTDKETMETVIGYAHSIAKNGLQEPLHVWAEEDKLWVSAGTLRLYAVLYANKNLDANIQAIPVTLAESHESNADRIVNQLTLNNTKPLTLLEQAAGIKMLIAQGWELSEICQKVNIPQGRLETLLLLSGADRAIIDMVKAGKVSNAFVLSTLKENRNSPKKALTILTKACAKAARNGAKKATKRTSGGPTSISRKMLRATVVRHSVVHHEADDEFEVTIRCKPEFASRIQAMLISEDENPELPL